MRQLALPLTFPRRACVLDTRRAQHRVACSGASVLGGSQGRRPKWPKQPQPAFQDPGFFAGFQLCGHSRFACPAFSDPARRVVRACCSTCRRLSRALCGPDWRVPSISVDRGFFFFFFGFLAVELRTAHRIASGEPADTTRRRRACEPVSLFLGPHWAGHAARLATVCRVPRVLGPPLC